MRLSDRNTNSCKTTANGEQDGADSLMDVEGSDDTGSTSNMTTSSMTNGTGTENNTSRSNTPTATSQLKKGKHIKRKKRKNNSSKYKAIVSNAKYSYSCMAREDHGKPIFGAQFHQKLKPDEPLILATVGSNRISVYECIKEGSLKILQVYSDPDDKEEFYTCAWTENDKGEPLLAAAGARGVIRIISPAAGECVQHYLGHGHSINELVFHPRDPNLLLSASKDHSLRLWNIQTNICVAIFGGVEGHRDEVVSADFDERGEKIVTCGIDHSLKVWKLYHPEIQEVIRQSYTWKHDTLGRNGKVTAHKPFPTAHRHFPDYSTRDVHRNYVDCVKWFGDFIFSKSCENTIVCWKGGKVFQTWDEITPATTETTEIMRLDVKDCDLWFIRFCLDFEKTTLALGNQNGKTYIFDLTAEDPAKVSKCTVLMHPKCTKAIRQTAMSRDGSVLICVCDDATIWRYDINRDEDTDG